MILELGGKPAYVYAAGHALDRSKPTLVFVHGAGFDHSWWGLQSRYFGYHGWNVLAVDLPGHGRSEGPPVPDVNGMAEWILKVLDSCEVQKASIVGHSMGALVAMECAARQRGRIDKIALIGMTYPMKVGEAFLDAARRNDHAAYDMETIWGHAAQAPLGGNPNPGMWMYGDTLARLERLAPGVLYNDLKACNDFVFSGEIRCPALMVLGGRDVMTPAKSALAFSKSLHDVRVVTAAQSGHSLMAEAPDATLDALIEFFR